jgi:hypothetical protein
MKTRDLRQLLFTIAILAVLALFTTSSVFAGRDRFLPNDQWSVAFSTQEGQKDTRVYIASCRAETEDGSPFNGFYRIDERGNQYLSVEDHKVNIEYFENDGTGGHKIVATGTGSLLWECWGSCGPVFDPPPQERYENNIIIKGEMEYIDGRIYWKDDTFQIYCHNWDKGAKRLVGKIILYFHPSR